MLIARVLHARAAGGFWIDTVVLNSANRSVVAGESELGALDQYRDGVTLVARVAECAKCLWRITQSRLVVYLGVRVAACVEVERWNEQQGVQSEGPDHVIEHADVGHDAKAKLGQRLTLARLLARTFLLVLLGALLVLSAIEHVSPRVPMDRRLAVVHQLLVLFLHDRGIRFAIRLVRLEIGQAVAALGGDPFEVGVGHVDRILLNRVNLVNQLVGVVDLISRERLS